MSKPFLLAVLALGGSAQELFLTTTGNSARPQCTTQIDSPSYFFQSFSYTLNATVRYVLKRVGVYLNPA